MVVKWSLICFKPSSLKVKQSFRASRCRSLKYNSSCCLEEVCGCKPWHVPAEDGTKTCFVLGNVCFSQVMDKIRQKKVSADIDKTRSMFKLQTKCSSKIISSPITHLSLENHNVRSFQVFTQNHQWRT